MIDSMVELLKSEQQDDYAKKFEESTGVIAMIDGCMKDIDTEMIEVHNEVRICLGDARRS